MCLLMYSKFERGQTSTKQDRQALQRVVRSAERITHTELPDLQTIYYKRCQTKARRIVKDPTHPNNRLFSLLSFYFPFPDLRDAASTLQLLHISFILKNRNNYASVPLFQSPLSFQD
ncbi:hypothetical protein P4O66_004166 [Electrophorus voltai]|uniref:Uncharacterized protein n=1 Tax=Electrophorus voltai TaxID=2609070 RepID=A0AAD8ZP07_9TELE|nr:hypothetical protein P4O66_004166 [Electrophorus voltai]